MSTTNSAPRYCGKRFTPRTSARTYCRWCNGGSPASCVSPECPLYEWRLLKPTSAPKLSTLRAIRARCLECAGSAEAVRTCMAFKPFSEAQPECPLWPHREGKRAVTNQYRLERAEQARRQDREPGLGGGFVCQGSAGNLFHV